MANARLQTWHTRAPIPNLLRNRRSDNHYHPDPKPNHDMNPKPKPNTNPNRNTDANTHPNPKTTWRPNTELTAEYS